MADEIQDRDDAERRNQQASLDRRKLVEEQKARDDANPDLATKQQDDAQKRIDLAKTAREQDVPININTVKQPSPAPEPPKWSHVPPPTIEKPTNKSDVLALWSAIKRLQDAHAAAMREVDFVKANLPDPTDRTFQRIFLAKITGAGADGTKHTWQEVTNDNGTVENFTSGRKCTDATDASAAREITGKTYVATDTYVLMLEIEDRTAFRYHFGLGGGDAVAFKITSATGTTGLYNAKSITTGTATTSSYGTLAGSEDLLVWNGAETAVASSNNLLVSPNTSTFDVVASGVVVGFDTGSSKRIVVAWIGYAGCEETADTEFDGGSP